MQQTRQEGNEEQGTGKRTEERNLCTFPKSRRRLQNLKEETTSKLCVSRRAGEKGTETVGFEEEGEGLVLLLLTSVRLSEGETERCSSASCSWQVWVAWGCQVGDD